MMPTMTSLAPLALLLSACSTTSDSTTQGVIGAAIGAAGGAGIATALGGNALLGAAVGASAGAGAGVLLSEANKGPIEGDVREGACARRDARPGDSVPGQSGSMWADLDGDGCVDGYVRQGRYYQDLPQG